MEIINFKKKNIIPLTGNESKSCVGQNDIQFVKKGFKKEDTDDKEYHKCRENWHYTCK